MDLKQLQYFLAVAKHLNFSKAAESLYISQPTLSYQIAELERELGTTLFIRDRRRVFLSPAGGALIPLANRTLNSAQEILDLAQRGFPETERLESLAVAFDQTEDHFECSGATALMARFANEYPEVELKMTQAGYESCIAGLVNEQVDAAFLVLRYNETLPRILNSRVFFEDQLVLVTQKNPAIHNAAEALRQYRLVAVESRPHALTRIQRVFDQEGVEVNPVFVDSIPVSFACVQAGVGAMILPRNYFERHGYTDLQAFEIPSKAASLTHVIAWNKTSSNPCIQRLVSMIK